MPAYIPRVGFEQRLAQLRVQRDELNARIAEGEYWLATLDAIEAENPPVTIEPPPAKRPRARRG